MRSWHTTDDHPSWTATYPARALISLGAIQNNVAALRAATEAPHLMAVVKADAYGHGLLPVAQAAVAAGATWLGTAQASEALLLREELSRKPVEIGGDDGFGAGADDDASDDAREAGASDDAAREADEGAREAASDVVDEADDAEAAARVEGASAAAALDQSAPDDAASNAGSVASAAAQPRILTWLHAPGAPFAKLIDADIDISVAADWDLTEVAAAARHCGKRANVHVKVDTGLGRNGLMPDQLPAFAARLAELEAAGLINVVGVWSHLAYADSPGHPVIGDQQQVFDSAVNIIEAAGIEVELRHLANSAATLTDPSLHYDMVRPGISVYGFSPVPQVAPPSEFGLHPAMTLEAALATVKDVPADQGVSYAHRYRTTMPTKLAVVPLGYADGIERHASSSNEDHAPSALAGPDKLGGPVFSDGRLLRVAGRVCMDQFVIDLGPEGLEQAGDVVTLFGDSDGLGYGATLPNAEDWAVAADTISYVITTQLGTRVPRVYVN